MFSTASKYAWDIRIPCASVCLGMYFGTFDLALHVVGSVYFLFDKHLLLVTPNNYKSSSCDGFSFSCSKHCTNNRCAVGPFVSNRFIMKEAFSYVVIARLFTSLSHSSGVRSPFLYSNGDILAALKLLVNVLMLFPHCFLYLAEIVISLCMLVENSSPNNNFAACM